MFVFPAKHLPDEHDSVWMVSLADVRCLFLSETRIMIGLQLERGER